MYVDMALHNDAAQLEMARASRKAAEGWRFRHLKPRGQKLLTAILASLVAFLARWSPGVCVDG
jgi:hypothetical protein